jgi:hypothetical protein
MEIINPSSVVESAEKIKKSYVAGMGGIPPYTQVYLSAANTVLPGNGSAESSAQIIGMTEGNSIAEGVSGDITEYGEIVNAGWSFTVPGFIWLDPDTTSGESTATPPSYTGAGKYSNLVAIIEAPTKIFVRSNPDKTIPL